MQHEDLLRADLARPGLAWLTSARHEDVARTLEWLRVVELGRGRLTLGLARSGWWVREAGDRAVEFAPGVDVRFLLPILEENRDEFEAQIREALARLGLLPGHAEKLPIERVLALALGDRSVRWPELALRWLQPEDMSASIIKALEELRSHGATQRLRHDAKRLLRVR